MSSCLLMNIICMYIYAVIICSMYVSKTYIYNKLCKHALLNKYNALSVVYNIMYVEYNAIWNEYNALCDEYNGM
jgi:hypothetical protein